MLCWPVSEVLTCTIKQGLIWDKGLFFLSCIVRRLRATSWGKCWLLREATKLKTLMSSLRTAKRLWIRLILKLWTEFTPFRPLFRLRIWGRKKWSILRWSSRTRRAVRLLKRKKKMKLKKKMKIKNKIINY